MIIYHIVRSYSETCKFKPVFDLQGLGGFDTFDVFYMYIL